VSAQWERVNPDEHDYVDPRWDYAHDGYLKVFVHRTIRFTCGRCEREYHHFFVSHADWLRVPLALRSLRLCVDCYTQALSAGRSHPL
jgi:hypothetical protein